MASLYFLCAYRERVLPQPNLYLICIVVAFAIASLYARHFCEFANFFFSLFRFVAVVFFQCSFAWECAAYSSVYDLAHTLIEAHTVT